MKQISTETKQAIIAKVLAKDGRTLSEIAQAHNIGLSTLARWLKNYRENVTMTQQQDTNKGQCLSLAAKLHHIIATATLDEATIGVYCREHGLYSFQLSKWKEEFMNPKHHHQQAANRAELKALRMENKQLKQELRRKDSALAEATALLILKKKQP